jgi:hypothetical protein
MIGKDINPVLVSLGKRISHENSLEDLHGRVIDICKEFNFFEEVERSSLLLFQLHFELWGRKESESIDVYPFVKKLYGFSVNNRETWMFDESQIAGYLFTEVAKLHPVLSVILESKKEVLGIAND